MFIGKKALLGSTLRQICLQIFGGQEQEQFAKEKYIKIQENVESYYTKGQVKSREDQNKKTHKECMQTLALEDIPFMISALKKPTFLKQNIDIE